MPYNIFKQKAVQGLFALSLSALISMAHTTGKVETEEQQPPIQPPCILIDDVWENIYQYLPYGEGLGKMAGTCRYFKAQREHYFINRLFRFYGKEQATLLFSDLKEKHPTRIIPILHRFFAPQNQRTLKGTSFLKDLDDYLKDPFEKFLTASCTSQICYETTHFNSNGTLSLDLKHKDFFTHPGSLIDDLGQPYEVTYNFTKAGIMRKWQLDITNIQEKSIYKETINLDINGRFKLSTNTATTTYFILDQVMFFRAIEGQLHSPKFIHNKQNLQSFKATLITPEQDFIFMGEDQQIITPPEEHLLVTKNKEEPHKKISYSSNLTFGIDAQNNLLNKDGEYLLGYPLYNQQKRPSDIDLRSINKLEIVNLTPRDYDITPTSEINITVGGLIQGEDNALDFEVRIINPLGHLHLLCFTLFHSPPPNVLTFKTGGRNYNLGKNIKALLNSDGPNEGKPYESIQIDLTKPFRIPPLRVIWEQDNLPPSDIQITLENIQGQDPAPYMGRSRENGKGILNLFDAYLVPHWKGKDGEIITLSYEKPWETRH